MAPGSEGRFASLALGIAPAEHGSYNTGRRQAIVEIARNLTANVWKLGLGIGLVALAVLLLADDPRSWIGPALFAVPGVPLVVSNVFLLVTRRPWLRATSDGVWFGGGLTIPWREIGAIYEAGVPIQRYGYSVLTRAIGFAFHRRRTVLRLPPSLWLR